MVLDNYLEAEQKFCSAVLQDPDLLLEIDVNTQWFELSEVRQIIEAAQSAVRRGVDYTRDYHGILSEVDPARLSEYVSNYVPSFNARHYLDTVKNAYRSRQLTRLATSIAQAAESDDENIISRARQFLEEAERRTVETATTTITAEYLLTTDFPEPKWIVKNILPAGLAFLAGKPKAGKSWLAMQLAHAVGTGAPFLGVNTTRQKVLYIALEDSPRRLSQRMKLQNWENRTSVRFITPAQHSLIGALEKGGVDKVLAHIARHNYGLVIIDTLTRAIDSDQFSPQDMKRTLSPLQTGALKRDACVLLIDHMPKLSGTEENVISDVYGSISKVGIADTIIGFYRDRNMDTGKIAGVGRDIEEFSFAVKFFKDRGMWLPVDEHIRARYTEQRHEVLEYVTGELETTVTHASVDLNLNKGTVQRVLNDLESDNLLLSYKDGRKRVYQATVAGKETLERWNNEIQAAKALVNG